MARGSMLGRFRGRLAKRGGRRDARVAAQPAPGRTGVAQYAPRADGRPDPGEVVWAWVPYEDDPQQGKDRPVLVLAVSQGEPGAVLALMLTSQDHDRDAAEEARRGRHWMDVGTGGWDRQRRPSEVRLDRLLRLPLDAVRREGAALDRPVFDAVVAAARQFHPRL
ncbi:type II toxin-antitoxin system PemK/MazF family toxin [Nocardioides sp. R-C-SC26]|uniref:type II toxin-antitoxin system PemK/MazF family toxin n=1 Tax=Nocardioides sp. R-C-SC26 TaxID=2870414 RepID=UPI001E3AAB0E|nr:type II toxin-antitoxin system PemK/MazF family toxin [Nocardioides sp. R-C-SC26]